MLTELRQHSAVDLALRERISQRAIALVKRIRDHSDPSMMELFLGEYGLSTDEGVALMCLAEALLRVPDGETMDALIEDKIAPSQWGQHLGQSNSVLINASTWALFFTGKVLADTEDRSVVSILHGAVKRLGEPVIRQAVARVMKELGSQFVLGESIEAAIERAKSLEARGYTYSYDMLGEAALSRADAKKYLIAYTHAITQLASISSAADVAMNPGISIKLSALHPRYEWRNRERVMQQLVPRLLALAELAYAAGIGLNIDAEEAQHLELSLDVIAAVAEHENLIGWDGLGIVVQAYGQRAAKVIDWVYALAEKLDRRFMVRLVKGAYWDSEIKHAQVEGHADYPVFVDKAATDVSYILCAEKLLGMADRIYPQFATHNAHTVAAILELANESSEFEFQRLHGMGEALHEMVMQRHATRCRIYAPVGAHQDLLAYLVRRLLENGANSSFVNQIVDEDVPPEVVAADPFEVLDDLSCHAVERRIPLPANLYHPQRLNSVGFDLQDRSTLDSLRRGLDNLADRHWSAQAKSADTVAVHNPADNTVVGRVTYVSPEEVQRICAGVVPWNAPVATRAAVLRATAELFERHTFELFSLLMREAGKTLPDCVAELREAVDFLRFYAAQAEQDQLQSNGVFACISPWNFPLAIFSGQVSAALAVGNGVIAKPAENTSLIAEFAISLFIQAGVPDDVLVGVVGKGADAGAAVVAHPNVDGVCFTGSTETAQRINRSMAQNLSPSAPLVAETGGINAMLVDSTALPEQAITDVLSSAFQSAGQRCSALRVLYLQEDIADQFLARLFDAMDELVVGNPKDFDVDVGPLIHAQAQGEIDRYVESARREGRLLKQLGRPVEGCFVAPTVISVDGIQNVEREIFGPVLHVARFEVADLDRVVQAINTTGYGLTFGLHTRIDDRVQYLVDRIRVGNLYVNRNQIGAVVGTQPFGGEGLSGTGPKAGGDQYLHRFVLTPVESMDASDQTFCADTEPPCSLTSIEQAFDACGYDPAKVLDSRTLPGPTGESNVLSRHPRGRVLCLGPSETQAQQQLTQAADLQCAAIALPLMGGSQQVSIDDLTHIPDLRAVVCFGGDLVAVRRALAARSGAIVPLLAGADYQRWLVVERHVCINTTAAGGNASLLEL